MKPKRLNKTLKNRCFFLVSKRNKHLKSSHCNILKTLFKKKEIIYIYIYIWFLFFNKVFKMLQWLDFRCLFLFEIQKKRRFCKVLFKRFGFIHKLPQFIYSFIYVYRYLRGSLSICTRIKTTIERSNDQVRKHTHILIYIANIYKHK